MGRVCDALPPVVTRFHTMTTKEELLARRYTFVVRAKDTGWTVHFPDLPGARMYTERIEDVGRVAKSLYSHWAESHFRAGLALPEPNATDMTDQWDLNDPKPYLELLTTARELSIELGISVTRVHTMARDRGLGTMRGNVRFFTPSEREVMLALPIRRPGDTKTTG